MENFQGKDNDLPPKKDSSHIRLNDQDIAWNDEVINAEAGWLNEILNHHVNEHLNSRLSVDFSRIVPPAVNDKRGPYAQLVNEMKLSPIERLLLIITFIPHYKPELFTGMLMHEAQHMRVKYTEAGGYIHPVFFQYVPSFQTLLFLLGEKATCSPTFHWLILNRQSKLFSEQLITLETLPGYANDNVLHMIPVLAGEYVRFLKTAEKPRPDFGRAFPARLVTTPLEWNDLVLKKHTMQQLHFIMKWIEKGDMLSKVHPRMNKSFPCLFYGPPGTGKSLAAKLIGKHFGKDVFRIDLSMIVSKYIGETEKNLAYLFDRAQGKDWILFFDEADSLFGKRTSISDAKDRWANLEMSYLLQRMEEYTGITILATNIRSNLDHAMVRRFQAMVHFPRPGQKERELLWRKAIPSYFRYDPSIDIVKLAQHEFTGANIANIMKAACIDALVKETNIISADGLIEAIRNEFVKEDRTP